MFVINYRCAAYREGEAKEAPPKAQSAEINDATQQILTIHLAEYQAMRAELLQAQGALSQLLLYSMVSLGAAIPILGTLLQNRTWQALLVVPVVFSSMGWIYSGYIGISYRVSIYINNFLRPSIMALLTGRPFAENVEVLYWEHFAHRRRLDILTLRKGFETLFFVLPSVGSIALYLILSRSVGFKITYIDWTLLVFDTLLTVGALLITAIVTATGSRRLKEGLK